MLSKAGGENCGKGVGKRGGDGGGDGGGEEGGEERGGCLALHREEEKEKLRGSVWLRSVAGLAGAAVDVRGVLPEKKAEEAVGVKSGLCLNFVTQHFSCSSI